MKMADSISGKLLIILALVCGFSCRNSLNQKILNYLDNECQFVADSCVITLDDFTKFEWDVMYIFEEMNSELGINPIIGFEYTGKGTWWSDKLLIFVKDNKVVYEERRNNYWAFGGLPYSEPIYNQPFLVKRVEVDDGKYHYSLYLQ